MYERYYGGMYFNFASKIIHLIPLNYLKNWSEWNNFGYNLKIKSQEKLQEKLQEKSQEKSQEKLQIFENELIKKLLI